MQPLHLSSSWQETKEKLKEINIDLSDDDLDYMPGKEDELLSHLSQKMNKSVEDIRGWIESVSANKNIAG